MFQLYRTELMRMRFIEMQKGIGQIDMQNILHANVKLCIFDGLL